LTKLRRFDDAERFAKAALEIRIEKEQWAAVAITYDCLGIIESARSKFDAAYSYDLKAYEILLRTSAPTTMRAVLANLCDITDHLNLLKERKIFASELREFANTNNDDLARMRAEFALGKISLCENEPHEAVKHFEIMLGLYNYAQEDELFCMPESAAEAYERIGDFEKALFWKKKQEEVEREMLNNKHLAIARYERLLREQSEAHTKEVAEMELSQKNRELSNTTLQLLAQTELLSDLRADLLQIARKIPPTEPAARELRERVKNLPCQSIDWEKFDVQFKAAHPEFVKKLIAAVPEISPMEIRVCTLIRMNLKSEEIARMFCVTERAIEFHRLNVRKKMGLKKTDNLSLVLAKM
jgi:DNA-binding CsgD family transcriptional regulator